MNAKDKQQIINDIYSHILQVVNRILHKAKNYSIQVLQLENPSLTQIAEQLQEIGLLMGAISSDFDEYTHSKAVVYIDHCKRIAEAVTAGDATALATSVAELDGRPFL